MQPQYQNTNQNHSKILETPKHLAGSLSLFALLRPHTAKWRHGKSVSLLERELNDLNGRNRAPKLELLSKHIDSEKCSEHDYIQCELGVGRAPRRE